MVSGRYVGSFSLPLAGLRVLLLGSAVNAPDPLIKRGEMGVILYQGDSTTPTMDKLELGVPRGLGGLEFTYLGEGKYSGFQVSRDPGNILVWIASSLFILGISLVLYFPHRQVWVLIAPRAGGGSHLLVRSATPRSGSALNELEVLSQEMESNLKTRRADSTALPVGE
ncbi:MAG: cytochrome c biogenesis protein ResB [Chloroflexota bacterium]